MMVIKMTFGTMLKTLRTRYNLSQSELAEKTGVKQYVISCWESDKTEPNISQIKKLCDILNVPADYLLGRNVIMAQNQTEFSVVARNFVLDSNDIFIKRIIEINDQLSEKQKQELIKLINITLDFNSRHQNK